ncbi:iron complex outermembrane recepter protein [Nitrosomonas sp. Nm51]|uniref:TonB-dependent receptor plug domain-containing protein n=1 Tax=Nitrosomonas sp. Nm51 TaxID=133720 RepID=UPI0008CC3AED|nr:TonB-dependent receptor [Nitrosomonas sp. Nm51]SER61333.1 iron complex outermembrane recepter protein [Nitrosomonas sp. Nm51]
MAILNKNSRILRDFYRLVSVARMLSGLKQPQFKLSIQKLLVSVMLCCFTSYAIASRMPDEDQLLSLSIEELMDIRVVNVSSVSRRTQKLTETASAIFVITQEDIRRSGVTNIPDALRMAPGVQVGRIDTNKWAVSIRGFNGLSSSKVQILVDGRSDYSPLFAGALWSLQDTFMEDIERIEIIRGPAASVWGTNAVNGVINIITKKAGDTQGTLLTAGGGSFEQGFAGARYGGKINEQTPFRIYSKVSTRDNTQLLSGAANNDQWHTARGGFRVDHTRGIDKFSLHGEIFYNSIGGTFTGNSQESEHVRGNDREHQEGGYMRFRWDRAFSDQSALRIQAAYDQTRHQLLPYSKYEVENFDADLLHSFPLFEKHNLTWGAHYRLTNNKVFDTEIVQFNPSRRDNHFFSLFVSDEITLIPDHLLFTLGTRLDHNDFTGLEIQPNTRLVWTPNSYNSIWMAISRAVRTPSRFENDVRSLVSGNSESLGGIPIQAIILGNRNFNSEKLLAYEIGYRYQHSERASIDIAGFINDYSHVRDLSFGALSLSSGLPQQFILPILPTNTASALTYGFEVSADWKPLDKWYLQSSYSYLNMHVSSNAQFKGSDPATGDAAKVSPHNQLSLRSNYDISHKLQLNLWLRYTSKIAFYDIPGYVAMDAKLVFKPVKNVELFLVGQNLLSENHREFVSEINTSTTALIPRGIYVGAQWRF